MNPDVVVVGGGITGLAAAYDLAVHGVDVVLVDGADRVGGRLATGPFAGLPAVDCAADSMLARVPWAVELCEELGLADELVSPAVSSAYLYRRGALRRLPHDTVLGVPLDLDALAASGLVSAGAVAACRADLARTVDAAQPAGDESVGALVRRRLGDEVFTTLVAPLLSGVNAGEADELSVEAGAPQLAAAAREQASLIGALRAQRAVVAGAPGAPVFRAHPAGMGHLVDTVARRLGARIRVGSAVRSLTRSASGWRVSLDDTSSYDTTSVVVAAPAFAAAPLLEPHAPQAAAALSNIRYASGVLVTLAIDRDTIEHPLDASGFLIPRDEGLFLTACSWASSKWAHLGGTRHAILRPSAGHMHDPRAIGMHDTELVERLMADLRATMGPLGDPDEVRVTRWERGLPQYPPGHLDTVAAIERDLARHAPGLVVTGAALRGLGIPACIRQGRDAATQVRSRLSGAP